MFLFFISYNSYFKDTLIFEIYEYDEMNFDEENIKFNLKNKNIKKIKKRELPDKMDDILYFLNRKELNYKDIPFQFFYFLGFNYDRVLEKYLIIDERIDIIDRIKEKFELDFNRKIKKIKINKINISDKNKLLSIAEQII